MGTTLMGQVMRCGRCHQSAPAPARCPGCGGHDFKRIGLGTEGLAALLEKEYAGAAVSFLTKETERKLEPHHILVTTDTYIQNHFNPFDNIPYGLVLMVNADQPLYRSEVRSTETALRSLFVWRSVAQAANARFMIQTSELELFSQMLADPEDIIRQELVMRSTYGLPPYKRWVSVLYRDKELRKAEHAIAQLTVVARKIEGVTPQRQERTPDGVRIKIAVEPEQIDKLLEFFTGLSDTYIIDTDVI